jgi:hypothetical protein
MKFKKGLYKIKIDKEKNKIYIKPAIFECGKCGYRKNKPFSICKKCDEENNWK